MTLSTAVLCLAVCVFDIINKTAMCGTSVDYIITQPFSCSSLAKKMNPHGYTLGTSDLNQKLFCCVNIDGTPDYLPISAF